MKLPRWDAVRVHTALSAFWALLTIPAVTLWRDSVPFLVSISMAALVLSSISAVQAAKADRNSPTVEDLQALDQKLDRVLAELSISPRIGRVLPITTEE